MTTTWHTPAPGTPAHLLRTTVRLTVWAALPTVLLILADPAARATLGL